jgi:hypothetical protein
MEMESVESSNVKAIGYDPKNSTVFVDFKNGASYEYYDVPERVFHELKNADSVGRFLNMEIKGSYSYSKI